MFRIFVHCSSRAMRYGDNKKNPKDYPYWQELIDLLSEKQSVTQITTLADKWYSNCHSYADFSMPHLVEVIQDEMDVFVSIDSFLPHMAHFYGKRGFVIFGQSDPLLFGYKENINILKDRKNLRAEQFWHWEQTPYKEDVFPTAEEVFQIINHYLDATTTYNSSSAR
jgi:hypothetical protein